MILKQHSAETFAFSYREILPLVFRSLCSPGAAGCDAWLIRVLEEEVATMDSLSQFFWDEFRRGFRQELYIRGASSRSSDWTSIRTGLGIQACNSVARAKGIEANAEVIKEYAVKLPGREARIDVCLVHGDRVLIAFETELAHWGLNGKSGKDWREEFIKLCGVEAQLRALYSCYKSGTGRQFPDELKSWLQTPELASAFRNRKGGELSLCFGPSDSKIDPPEAWYAFAVQSDYTLSQLQSPVPLRPRPLIKRTEKPDE